MTLSADRLNQLNAALAPNAEWGALINFLDSINDLNELNEMAPAVSEKDEMHCRYPLPGEKDCKLVKYYRETLTQWPNPILPTEVREKCPRLAARLDTPQKVRIFLRAVPVTANDTLLLGEFLEELIRRHEDGETKINFYRIDNLPWQRREIIDRMARYSQVQYWTLSRIALPDLKRSGWNCDDGYFFSWVIESKE